MSLWTPTKRWDAADVYIVGGGPSLRHFDWSLLTGKNVIGCNAAFKLGVATVPICFFSDKKWWDAFKSELEIYAAEGGEVFTHAIALDAYQIPFLKILQRRPRGLWHDAIGFNGNSGCSAVNLALLLGARRVFLLGFDCSLPALDTRTHWHDWRIEAPKAEVYEKFLKGWHNISIELPKSFPGCEVINLGPNSSIPYFPIGYFSQYLAA